MNSLKQFNKLKRIIMKNHFSSIPVLKGTVSVISSDPPCKAGNLPIYKRYPCNLNLIKNVKDIVVLFY